jgi:hypothetical protein
MTNILSRAISYYQTMLSTNLKGPKSEIGAACNISCRKKMSAGEIYAGMKKHNVIMYS